MKTLKINFAVLFLALFTFSIANIHNVFAQTKKEKFINYKAKEIADLVHPTSTYLGHGVAEAANGEVFLVLRLLDSNGKELLTTCRINFSHPKIITINIHSDEDCCAFWACNTSKIVLQELVREALNEYQISEALRELGSDWASLTCGQLFGLRLKLDWIAWR